MKEEWCYWARECGSNPGLVDEERCRSPAIAHGDIIDIVAYSLQASAVVSVVLYNAYNERPHANTFTWQVERRLAEGEGMQELPGFVSPIH